MLDLPGIEMEDGFNDDSILDFSCSIMGEEHPQMTIKGSEMSTVVGQNSFLHACLFIPAPLTLIRAVES